MSIGDTVVSDGVEFEVVWDGGEGLVGSRQTKPIGFWTPPKRLYNKKSDFWDKPRTKVGVDNPVEQADSVKIGGTE
jgi:hypothetical protein